MDVRSFTNLLFIGTILLSLIQGITSQWTMANHDAQMSGFATYNDRDLFLHFAPTTQMVNYAGSVAQGQGLRTPQMLINGSSVFYVSNQRATMAKRINSTLSSVWTSQQTVWSQLILVDGMVIAALSDNTGYIAFDQVTGAKSWSFQLPRNLTAPNGNHVNMDYPIQAPLLNPVDGHLVLHHATNDSFVSAILYVHVVSGSLTWAWIETYPSLTSVAISSSGIIYASLYQTNTSLIQISSTNGSILWSDVITPDDGYAISGISSTSVFLTSSSTIDSPTYQWNFRGNFTLLPYPMIIFGIFPDGDILAMIWVTQMNSWKLSRLGKWFTDLRSGDGQLHRNHNVIIDSRGFIFDSYKAGSYFYDFSSQMDVYDSTSGAFLWNWSSNSGRNTFNCGSNDIVGLPIPSDNSAEIYLLTCNYVVTITCCSGNGKCGSSLTECDCDENWHGETCEKFCDSEKCPNENSHCNEGNST
eukprot:TRINITY_DN3229_c0_g1_i3.p1 TRINITY_DN3229_c0_g1~~TRINITY_DN3229_c0_g1_i3.p1  ORF type:complete len:471 (+),score=63.88 TRINITY_DN3229_c0_g1_i3:66-1478(+)